MIMWFYQHKGEWFKSKRMTVWSLCNAFLFCLGITIVGSDIVAIRPIC